MPTQKSAHPCGGKTENPQSWRQNDPYWNTNSGNTPTCVSIGDERNYDSTKLADVPRLETALSEQIAGESPCMKMKHVEVLVQMMEVELSEQICPNWKGNRGSYGETHKIREPLLLGSIRSY